MKENMYCKMYLMCRPCKENNADIEDISCKNRANILMNILLANINAMF